MNLATLIPGFRRNYCISALSSALNQSVRPNLIIISDDSPNEEITRHIASLKLIEKLKAQNILLQVITGPRKQSGLLNMICLLEAWSDRTELFHFLLDDDYIFPTFYENHSRLLTENDLLASVSRRWKADEHGNVTGCFRIPDFIEKNHTKKLLLDPSSLFKSVVPQRQNWLGEFSNAIFHKAVLTDGVLPSELGGLPFYGLGDIGIFLKIGQQGKLGFINEHLSFFRSHDGQNTNNWGSPSLFAGYLAWIPIAISSKNLGFIDEHSKEKVIGNVLNLVDTRYKNSVFYDDIYRIFGQTLDSPKSNQAFSESEFIKRWKIFVNSSMAGHQTNFNVKNE
jgi:hypothetical protein